MESSVKSMESLKTSMLSKLENDNLVDGRLLAGCCTQGCCGELD
ncbi:hypothetical protein MNBD_BACTEROID03-1565 [hydrothermal vent metagenome]|uniref:Uncharacterized protein n=1 Tax=hydrothermal vent metagenome TaxID=652676 RepID=A0A3B0T2T2_9ZZZZ